MRPAELLYQALRAKSASISAVKKFSEWRDAVYSAMQGDETWAAASDRTRARLVGAIWADHTGVSACRYHKRRLNAPWAAVSASIREGVARVSCPACGQFHEHVPANGRRYGACGLIRYYVNLLPATEQPSPAADAGSSAYRSTLS
ncbi:MAG: hypothetical protein ACREIB_05825 [Pseudomonadota bacterium]